VGSLVNATPRPLYSRVQDPVPVVQEAALSPWTGTKLDRHILIGTGQFFSFPYLDSPSGPRPPPCWGLEITRRNTPHSLGLLWTSDQPDAETSTWHERQTSMSPAGFRHMIPASERPLGSRDEPNTRFNINLLNISNNVSLPMDQGVFPFVPLFCAFRGNNT
jgi:hypothetical protein